MTDKDREAFEGWVCEVGVLPLTKINAIDDEYLCPETETAWKAWQAARAESAKELAEKDAEIERLKRATEWQPIETAPKTAEQILATNGACETWVVFWYKNQWAAHVCADDYYSVYFDEGDLTHWMPLPDAPNTKKGG
jgi:hypothetical protein